MMYILTREVLLLFKAIGCLQLDRIIETVDQKKAVNIFNTVQEVELALKDHCVTNNTVGELVKLVHNEADEIISRLKEQVNKLIVGSGYKLRSQMLNRSKWPTLFWI